jgi:putative ABC transport system substrate-binding protein
LINTVILFLLLSSFLNRFMQPKHLINVKKLFIKAFSVIFQLRRRLFSVLPALVLSLFIWLPLCFADDPPSIQRIPRVSVVVSKNIKPYIEAVEGFNKILVKDAGMGLNTFELEKFKGKSRDGLKTKLLREPSDLFIAVGPEATRFLWSGMRGATPFIYTLVLDPENISESPGRLCGVSLRIPTEKQLNAIRLAIPSANRIGLLHDPDYNDAFFESARQIALDSDMKVIPMRVFSKPEISKVLKQYLGKVDVLWLIPDRTVISESIVKYIIRESFLKKIPVIGFNRFFFNSGAALAFVFDYETLGSQTANIAMDVLSGKPCRNTPPEFKVMVNTRVFKRLGLNMPADPPAELEVVP